MGYRVYFLNKLRNGIAPEDYERWVRDTDYPIARRDPSIHRYEVTRVEGTLSDESASVDYLEVLEVTDIEAYRNAIETPEFKALLGEWSEFIESSEAIHGGVIE
jgi:hypothetical protein